MEVSNSSGPVEGARVCLTNDDLSVYAVGFTDNTGEVVLDLGGPILDPGTATITVSHHNHLPYQQNIPINIQIKIDCYTNPERVQQNRPSNKERAR